MNALVRIPESQPRHKWTWDEFIRVSQAGFFDRDSGNRVELIEGELIEVSPQGMPHMRVKSWLNKAFYRELSPHDWVVFTDGPLAPSERSGPEPDLFIYPQGLPDDPLDGAAVALVIEVSDTSLDLDLKTKPHLYAARGVQEYWVVDINSRQIIQHRQVYAAGYRSVRTYVEGETLSAAALPQVEVVISEMP